MSVAAVSNGSFQSLIVVKEIRKDKEIMERIHTVVSSIIDPSVRCAQLINVVREDHTVKDEEWRFRFLNDAVDILENKVKDPDIKKIFSLQREASDKKALNRDLDLLMQMIPFVKDRYLYSKMTLELYRVYKGLGDEYNTSCALKEVMEMARFIDYGIKKTSIIDYVKEALPNVKNHYIFCEILLELYSFYKEVGDHIMAASVLDEAFAAAQVIADAKERIAILKPMSEAYGRVDNRKEISVLLVMCEAYSSMKRTKELFDLLGEVSAYSEDYPDNDPIRDEVCDAIDSAIKDYPEYAEKRGVL